MDYKNSIYLKIAKYEGLLGLFSLFGFNLANEVLSTRPFLKEYVILAAATLIIKPCFKSLRYLCCKYLHLNLG